MKGCRPLSDPEVAAVLNALNTGPFKLRNRALFLLGLRSGFRISELLSLTLGDVYRNGTFVNHVSVERSRMKGKLEGRTVALHPEAKEAIRIWVESKFHGSPVTTPLFLSRKGNPMDRRSAWALLKKAFAVCGLSGKLSCHTMRKTFAKRIHELGGRDLMKTQKALGHRSPASTVSYLSVDQEEIDDLILKS